MNATANITTVDGLTTLTLSGDLTEAAAIASEVNEVVDVIASRETDVIVDIRGVVAMGIGGLGVCSRLNAAVPPFGAGFAFRVTRGPVANILHLLRGTRPDVVAE